MNTICKKIFTCCLLAAALAGCRKNTEVQRGKTLTAMPPGGVCAMTPEQVQEFLNGITLTPTYDFEIITGPEMRSEADTVLMNEFFREQEEKQRKKQEALKNSSPVSY